MKPQQYHPRTHIREKREREKEREGRRKDKNVKMSPPSQPSMSLDCCSFAVLRSKRWSTEGGGKKPLGKVHSGQECPDISPRVGSFQSSGEKPQKWVWEHSGSSWFMMPSKDITAASQTSEPGVPHRTFPQHEAPSCHKVCLLPLSQPIIEAKHLGAFTTEECFESLTHKSPVSHSNVCATQPDKTMLCPSPPSN